MALTATLAPFRLMFFTGDHGMELLPWAHQTSAGFSLRGWLNWRWKLLKPVEDCLAMSLVWLVATALVAF